MTSNDLCEERGEDDLSANGAGKFTGGTLAAGADMDRGAGARKSEGGGARRAAGTEDRTRLFRQGKFLFKGVQDADVIRIAPYREPFRRTMTVFTAPMSADRLSQSCRWRMMLCLCGMVTLKPRKAKSGRPQKVAQILNQERPGTPN